MADALKCRKCGTINRASRYFCRSCGINLHMKDAAYRLQAEEEPLTSNEDSTSTEDEKGSKQAGTALTPEAVPLKLYPPCTVIPDEMPKPPLFTSNATPWGSGCLLTFGALFLSISLFELSGATIFVFLLLELFAIGYAYHLYDQRKRSEIQSQLAEWMRKEIGGREYEAQRTTEEARNLAESFHDQRQVLPELLRKAHSYLSAAEEEFQEKAYSPFWDNIEQAALSLGSFNSGLRRMESIFNRYNEVLRGRVHNFPPLDLKLGELPSPTPQAEGLRRLARMGQKNFEFATIWEHRKTQKVILEGFQTLGEAVNNLGTTVDDSFSRVVKSIEGNSARSLDESVRFRESFEDTARKWEEHKRLHGA